MWGITEGRQAAREVDTYLQVIKEAIFIISYFNHFYLMFQGSSALPGPAGVILPSENLIDQILMQADTTEVEGA